MSCPYLEQKGCVPGVKPDKCCDLGEYVCQIPMPVRGRVIGVDVCIADIVAALNAANILTVASCCGHGRIPANILLEDGRMLEWRLKSVYT